MKFRFYALKLCLFIIAIFLLQILFPGFTDLFLLNQNSFYEPWRFITSIFLHANLTHLIFNLFALVLFGSILERIIGERKFLYVFFSTGIIANLIAVFFYTASLGASGAIFGVIGALVLLRPMMVIWAFGMPMPMFIAGILWALNDLIGLFVPSDVGNIAHLSGLAIGLLFGIFYRTKYKEIKYKKELIEFDEDSIRRWEDRYMR